jgi:DNA-binding NtrC family response regulator
VIIVTAYGTPQTLGDLRRAGVADCFPKPFPIDMLRRSVRRALDATGDRRRLRRAGDAA